MPANWGAALSAEQELIDQHVAAKGIARVVPVRFTHILSTPDNNLLTQSQVDQSLSNLNAAFSTAGITFVQCGPIQFFYDNVFSPATGFDEQDYILRRNIHRKHCRCLQSYSSLIIITCPGCFGVSGTASLLYSFYEKSTFYFDTFTHGPISYRSNAGY